MNPVISEHIYIIDADKFSITDDTSTCTIARAKEIDTIGVKLNTLYFQTFLDTIRHDDFEDGYVSRTEALYEEIVKEYGNALAVNFLNGVYVYGCQNNDTKILFAILKIISNLHNRRQASESFSVIAISMLNYKNSEIVDEAISCFIKWGKKSDAAMLKNIKEPEEPWLQDYFKYAIKYLEDCRE